MESTALMSDDLLDSISNQAKAIYDERLKPMLEPGRNGEVVAIHLDSRDYEVAPSSSVARFTLRGRHDDGMIVTLDIGPVDAYDPLTLRMLGTQMLSVEFVEGGEVLAESL